jgi:phosphatidylglycerophosphatase A
MNHEERAAAPGRPQPAKKPAVSIFAATACGLGYLPKAPGTWGSLGGLLLAALPFLFWARVSLSFDAAGLADIFVMNRSVNPYVWPDFWPYFWTQLAVTILCAAIGVWTAGRAACFWGKKDPQRVVIDEVSGQHLTIFLGCALPIASQQVYGSWQSSVWGFLAHSRALNWKYLVAGFILFRAFDIWKPFPARQAEQLRGGWGIMADDWFAAIYAALGLWLLRAAGL